jgi:hypothetical protein
MWDAAKCNLYGDCLTKCLSSDYDKEKAIADALITLCPVCDQVLRQPAGRLGLKQIYITNLCRIALGEKAWPA